MNCLSFHKILFVSALYLFAFAMPGRAQKNKAVAAHYPLLEKIFGAQKTAKGLPWKADLADRTLLNGTPGEQIFIVLDTAFQYSPSEGTQHLVLLTHSRVYDDKGTEMNNCHACGTVIGYYQFREVDGKWELERADKALTRAGSFGADNYSIEVLPTTGASYIVVVKSRYEGMGAASETAELYQDGELLLRTYTHDSGTQFTASGEQSYENRTVFKVNKARNTLTATRTGTQLNKQGKKVSAAKTATWNYLTEAHGTWAF